jgi:hypothetical protein
MIELLPSFNKNNPIHYSRDTPVDFSSMNMTLVDGSRYQQILLVRVKCMILSKLNSTLLLQCKPPVVLFMH